MCGALQPGRVDLRIIELFVAAGRVARTVCIVALLLVVATNAAVAGGKRVAFVVGNGAYKAVPALENPKNDALAVSKALRKVGFEVVTAIDLDRAAFDKSVETFIRSLSDAELSVFYYSGHGVEVGGENRIIPVDAILATEASLEVETISLQTIMLQMRNNSRAQLLYLDACRDNPFSVKKFLVGADQIKKQVGRGLSKQDASVGSLIAYATEPGNIALDGDSINSPFTAAVLRHSFVANVDVQTALMQVTRDVWESTNEKQRPWSNATLVEPVFLNGMLVKAVKVDETVAKIEPAAPKAEAEVATKAVPETAAKAVPEVAAKPIEISAKRSTVGLGAQEVFEEADVSKLPVAAKFRLTKMPDSGTVSAAGETIAEGSELDAEALATLKFEPSIEPATIAPAIEIEATTEKGEVVPVVVKENIDVNACDLEAAEPLDLQGTQKGVLPNEINVEKALAACSLAVKDYPLEGRFVYQLGRAEFAAKHLDVAYKLFETASAAGHIRALNQLGYMAQRGLGRAQSLEDANAFFKDAADKGDPYGMLSYGRNLARGRGVKADVDAGLVYLNRAVEMGHTYAMNELGGMYLYGDPVKANPKRGIRFYEASMARGDIYGIRNMGDAYLRGLGVEKDAATALALFTKAAKSGHPSAPNDIGAMYFNGNGVDKNLDEAIKWYEQGAEKGDQRSAANLGWIFSQGQADHRDVTLAVQYTALAIALDTYGNDKDSLANLKALPEKAKTKAVRKLIATVGVENIETAADLDQTLVLLSRKAWQTRNPRLDLF
jgi:TPR repeat protein